MKQLLPILGLATIMCACSTHSTYQQTQQADVDQLSQTACFPIKVTVPTFPDRVFNAIDYGADPTGQALSTTVIQAAIDDCHNAGGGTVLLPGGVYFTGPLTLRSNVRIHTEKNRI